MRQRELGVLMCLLISVSSQPVKINVKYNNKSITYKAELRICERKQMRDRQRESELPV